MYTISYINTTINITYYQDLTQRYYDHKCVYDKQYIIPLCNVVQFHSDMMRIIGYNTLSLYTYKNTIAILVTINAIYKMLKCNA